MAPRGRLAFDACSAARTSSMLTPRRFRENGISSTRTAGSVPPPSSTSPTPGTCAIFCCSRLDTASYTCPGVLVLDVSAKIITGAAAGLALRYVGLLRRVDGRSARAALMAPWTSRAAESICRFRSNCSVTRVEPVLLLDVISLTPAMTASRRSSGVATLDAMVSGLAPGSDALTEITG